MFLTFLGGTGTVTGSKYLLQTEHHRLLVDCGLFQGYKQLRLRNWAGLPFDPASLDAVILTHAHLDHSGYLPALIRDGFKGPVYASAASCELAGILLPDSGYLQEEEADYANRRGYSKHHPAQPLYTLADAEAALPSLVPLDFGRCQQIGPDLGLTLQPAGHILGAANVIIRAENRTLVFSGDLGRQHDPIMPPPAPLPQADYLLVESTYGDRRHPVEDVATLLAETILRTVKRGGITIIPAFAVERAQILLYYLYRLKQQGRLPADLPIYLNSPMASNVTQLYQRYQHDHRLSATDCAGLFGVAQIINSVDESRQLNQQTRPAVIIAASGMATGGRVLHHIKAFAPDARNTLLFAGFQAGGTRGALITGGAEHVRIHGEDVPIRCEVVALEHLSAHADADEIMQWLQTQSTPPRQTFIVHGEPAASDSLRRRIGQQLGWPCSVPEQGQQVRLD